MTGYGRKGYILIVCIPSLLLPSSLLQAIEYNLTNLKKWAVSAASEKAHILAVGELFLCGYNIRPQDREDASVKLEEVVAIVMPIAIDNQIALVVPYAEKVEGSDQMYDSMVLIDKEGNLLKNYRKTHLWGSDERTVWKYPYTDAPDEARHFSQNDCL